MERLRHIREQAGYSQQELADESGVSQHTISEIELGRRKPQGRTLRKLANVLGVEVRDFFEEPVSPLGQAPPSAEQRSFNNHLLEEEQRAEWDAAVRSAHQLKEHGRPRMQELLSAWRASKAREEDAAERRAYLDEMGELLQAAYDARLTLFQAMSYERWPEQWPELGEADQFYRELWDLVESAGLSIRAGNTQEERPQAVEETKAA